MNEFYYYTESLILLFTTFQLNIWKGQLINSVCILVYDDIYIKYTYMYIFTPLHKKK